MINIRQGCYETNSSSCHSICISKKQVKPGNFIHFGLDDFGWDPNEVYNTEDYLYTAIVTSFKAEETDKYLKRLKKILDKNCIRYEFEPIKLVHHEWGNFYEPVKEYGWGYGIDHGSKLRPMIEALLADENLLMRYLFGNTVIYTGNDNSCELEDMCFIADVYNKTNSHYRPDKYDYFFKGN